MNRFKKFISTVMSFIIGVTMCGTVLAGCSEKEPESTAKTEYTFVYNPNYEGATNRTVTVKAGSRANNWKPSRNGYTFEKWYKEAECTTEFDFTQYINADTTVYANWNKNAEKFMVTFDFNYENADPVEVGVMEGKKLPAESIPSSPRLGKTIEGWYKDKACTANQKFDVENTAVNESITLYANYSDDSSVVRNDDGSVKFENVTVKLVADCGPDYFKDGIKAYIAKFNTANVGKIKIELVDQVGDDVGLKFKQMTTINEMSSTSYAAADVFDFAGITFDAQDWYANAMKDSYLNGVLQAAPVAAAVPFAVYNKTLMNKYLSEGQTVADINSYSKLSQLLNSAYNGESVANANFKSFVLNANHWSFKEMPSAIAFVQNGAPYYSYENGKIVNKWKDATVEANATAALTNTYNIFGAKGTLHGSAMIGNADGVVNAVKSGNALMGVLNQTTLYATKVTDSETFGIMPLSGLFTDSTSAEKDYIPVHTFGFTFSKADNVSLTQLAACAEFASFVSKQTDMGKFGWYPLNKTTAQSDGFKNSSDGVAKVLLQTGNPENFFTHDGYVNERNIINKVAAEGIVVPTLELEQVDYSALIQSLKETIIAWLG